MILYYKLRYIPRPFSYQWDWVEHCGRFESREHWDKFVIRERMAEREAEIMPSELAKFDA